jgi:hypothetical protein
VDGAPTLIRKDTFNKEVLGMEEKIRMENRPTECVLCGCAPKPDEWSSQVENACLDCA